MTCDSSQILNTSHKGKFLKMPWEASKTYLVARDSLWIAHQTWLEGAHGQRVAARRERSRGQGEQDATPPPSSQGAEDTQVG